MATYINKQTDDGTAMKFMKTIQRKEYLEINLKMWKTLH